MLLHHFHMFLHHIIHHFTFYTAGKDVGDNWSGREQVEGVRATGSRWRLAGGLIKEPRKQGGPESVNTGPRHPPAGPTSTSQRTDNGSWKLSLFTLGSGS